MLKDKICCFTATFNLRSGSASILILYFVLFATRDEKPFSHRYVVENRRNRVALSENTG